jgi:leader peptidase (prepilin peptidase)/N-methyltransferase
LEAYSQSIFVFIFGLCFGSFLNVLIIRLPLNQSLLSTSSCPLCHTKLAWYYNIPIFSYLFLKGHRASCGKKISTQYILVEGLSAFVTLGLFFKLGFSYDFFVACLFFYLLVVLSGIDLKYHAVPDYLLLMVLLTVFCMPSLPLLEQLQSAFMLSGAVVLLVFVLNFYIQNIKSRLTNNDALKNQTALGEGDIPIIAVMAALLGIQGALVAIFLASLFAIIPALYNKMVKKQHETPFIPFLSLGLGVEYIFTLSKVFH